LAVVAVVLTTSLFCGCSRATKKENVLPQAESYFKAGDYDKAKIEYQKALRQDPKNVVAQQRLGFMWLEEGAPLRAIPFLLSARELKPEDAKVREQLARALLLIGQSADARKEVLAILKNDPGNFQAIVLLADATIT
jgi:tetratricopeptide (TPR) repeat protein